MTIKKIFRVSFLLGVSILLFSCAGQKIRSASSVVDYLYSGKETKVSPSTPHLNLPLTVGIAFVPESGPQTRAHNFWSGQSYGHNITQAFKSDLLEKVAQNFRDLEFVEGITIIPSTYLRTKGGFENLDQISTMYGIDVIALVSYDQVQFTDEDFLSLSYWTLVGAYVVSGEKNDTSTMLDTAVYDISSRSMLFRAPGTSSVTGRSTPINLSEELRQDSAKGFRLAATDMVKNLELELDRFKSRIKNNPEKAIISHKEGYSGAGSAGLLELALLVIVWLRTRYKSN